MISLSGYFLCVTASVKNGFYRDCKPSSSIFIDVGFVIGYRIIRGEALDVMSVPRAHSRGGHARGRSPIGFR